MCTTWKLRNGFREDAFLCPEDPSRVFGVWNNNCIQCHSVGGAPGYGKRESDVESNVVELGIGCESCHGPGAEHVRAAQTARTGSLSSVREKIVHPGKLSPKRSSQICGQCHSYFLPKDNHDWWDHGYRSSYHAGGDLDQSRFHVLPEGNDNDAKVQEALERMGGTGNLYWPDGSVRVGGREYLGLIQSACFQRGEMSCLSCHSMHRYDKPNDLLKPMALGNEACLKCHTSYRENIQKHTHHPPASSGSDCYNCHMPQTTYALFKGIRNHRITSPIAESAVAKNRPNACNLCHLDQTRKWTADALARWYGQPRVAVEADLQNTADSVVLMLRGDAAQRAVAVWAAGWLPAQQASGSEWLIPFFAELLVDPYPAVRFMAYHSLKTIPGYETWEYNFLDPERERIRHKVALLEYWYERWKKKPHRSGEALLIDAEGRINWPEFDRLLKNRDHREISISE